MIPILWTFCADERCDVHQCLLAVRETKHGWFDLFCPGALACIDNGQLYSAMVAYIVSNHYHVFGILRRRIDSR